MSLKLILSGFWDGVKKLFSSLDKEAKQAIHISVMVVEVLKDIVGSQVVDILTTLIPGDKDDKIVAWARIILPEVLTKLLQAETYLDAIAKYQTLDGDTKSAMSGAIATNLTRAITDYKIGYDDTKALVSNYYKTEIKKAA